LVFPQSILRPAQSSCTDDVCGSQSRWLRTADGFAVWRRPTPQSALRLRRAVLHRPYRCSISSALCRCVSVRSITEEKHELSKVEFEIIDKALKALLQSNLDPLTADKVTDLRNTFRDAFTGWLEIDQEAA